MPKRVAGIAVAAVMLVAMGCAKDGNVESRFTGTTVASDATTATTAAPPTTAAALPLEEWASKADRICGEADRAVHDLDEPVTEEDAVAYVSDVLPIQQEQFDALTELGYPDDKADSVEEALGYLSDQLELIQQVIDDLDSGTPPEEAFAPLQEQGDEMDAQLSAIAEELGLEVCGADTSSTTATTAGGSEPVSYGDDPELDALWDACEAGDPDACDNLFFQSPSGSEYEDFGYSCGGVVPDGETAICSDVLGSGSNTNSDEAYTYGDDAVLDDLWDACDAGDGQACDDLFFQSPVDSEYETFGNTCGGRFDLGNVPFSCADEIGTN